MPQSQDREIFEMLIGVVMTQSALCDFMIKNGVIASAPLIEHLAARRIAWETTASASALFPVDTLLSLLAGKQPPARPPALH